MFARHFFFDKEYVLPLLINLRTFENEHLHLHLVDDQGGVLKIKKYPKLTEVVF